MQELNLESQLLFLIHIFDNLKKQLYSQVFTKIIKLIKILSIV